MVGGRREKGVEERKGGVVMRDGEEGGSEGEAEREGERSGSMEGGR